MRPAASVAFRSPYHPGRPSPSLSPGAHTFKVHHDGIVVEALLQMHPTKHLVVRDVDGAKLEPLEQPLNSVSEARQLLRAYTLYVLFRASRFANRDDFRLYYKCSWARASWSSLRLAGKRGRYDSFDTFPELAHEHPMCCVFACQH